MKTPIDKHIKDLKSFGWFILGCWAFCFVMAIAVAPLWALVYFFGD